MDSPQFNLFDAAVALILFASGIFAFRRGLVKEVMALGTWILSSIFAFAFYPLAQPFLHDYIENEMLADAATGLGLFSLAVIILVPFGDYLSNLAKNPTLNSIDRSLGFVFGLVRGFLIVCLIFLGLNFVWPEEQDDQPEWLASSRTAPALAYGIEVVQSVVPEDAQKETEKQMEESRKAAKEAVEAAQRLEDFSTPVPFNYEDDDEEPSSYGDGARDTMDNLIDGKPAE